MKTVLTVDDHEHILIIISKYLANEGLNVITYQDSFDALTDLIEGKIAPDLIISDISMPKLNGLQFARELKKYEQTQDIPVIFLSAMEDEFLHKKSAETGVVEYILKPVEKEQLIQMVKNHLK
jgi:CheY-like chemotaxis protein